MSLDIDHLINALRLDHSFAQSHSLVSFCTQDGITYHIGDILLVDIEFEVTGIKFLQVQHILIEKDSNKISFIGTLFRCLGFDFHVFAHEVERTDEQIFVNWDELYSPVVPHTITTLANFKTFITLRIKIT